jgi:hypothetical protein
MPSRPLAARVAEGTDSTGAGSGPLVIGRAVTVGQALPLGVDDPVMAARAVRRALADAHRRAADVTLMVVACAPPIPEDAIASFARRALGPHGADVHVAGVAGTAADAEGLAAQAASELAARRTGEDSGCVGIAVGLGADGTTVACCLAIDEPREPAGT